MSNVEIPDPRFGPGSTNSRNLRILVASAVVLVLVGTALIVSGSRPEKSQDGGSTSSPVDTSDDPGSPFEDRSAIPDFDLPNPDIRIPAFDESTRSVLPEKPNIVVIQTDDQTLESLRVMPNTLELLGAEGVEFTQAVSNYPLCCPARAVLLTGQHSHNNGVLYNKPPTGGFESFHGQDTTIPAALQKSGYRTIHVGKYMNGYGRSDPKLVPPGWDDWFTLVDPTSYRYFGFQVNENGVVRRYQPESGNYQTDVLFDRALEVVAREAAEEGSYLLMLDTLAPHVDTLTGDDTAEVWGRGIKSAVPAPRHEGTLEGTTLPEDPTFNSVEGNPPPFVRNRPPLEEEAIADLTDSYQAELESLLAVDEGIERLVRGLEAEGELDNTVIVFLSDNGLLHGQRRVVGVKYYAWEPSVRIPLIIRVPGLTGGKKVNNSVSTVDVAATILDLAGARPLRELDGRSLTPLLVDPSESWDRGVLLETGENVDGLIVYQGIRTMKWKYVVYGDGNFEELYDLGMDPFETRNLAEDSSYSEVRDVLAKRLQVLRDCAGSGCR